MSRRKKFWLRVSASIAMLIVLVLIAGIETIKSAWFSTYVRQKIVTVTEQSTGGRAEIGAFAFDWKHLDARITGFVLHGKETPQDAPLLRIETIEVRLKLLPSLRHTVDLEYLGVDRPSANIVVFPDGTTNIPEPRISSKSNRSALEEVVDLAIHRFDLSGGSIAFAQQKIPLRAQGRDLRAQLFFNTATSVYRGNLSFQTVNVIQRNRPPVQMSVNVPVEIGKNSIKVESASVKSADSSIGVSGSFINPEHPSISAHVIAHVSLAEVNRATGIVPGACARQQLCFMDADIQGQADEQKALVSKAAITLGHSRLNISGDRQTAYVEARLAMDEIGTLFRFSGDSIGEVELEGEVKQQGNRIDVPNMRIHVLGAVLAVDGSLSNYDQFQVHGKLAALRLADIERRFLGTKQGYEGTIAGNIEASGRINESVLAHAKLEIIPGARGVPLKGRLAADYDGASRLVKIESASFSLPHSLIHADGILGRRVEANFMTTDPQDLYPMLAMTMKSPPSEMPLTLQGGMLKVRARADGPIASPFITAHVDATRFAWEKRAFDRFGADVSASERQVAIQNGALARGTLEATFSVATGLRNWALANDQRIQATAQLRNAELPDLLAIADEADIPAAGTLNASLDAQGTVGNPLGNVTISAANGNIYGEPFETFDLQAVLTDRLVRLARANWTGPAGSIQAGGTYSHSVDNMLSGDLQLHAASNSLRLGAVANVTKRRPGMDGTLHLNLDSAASVRQQKGKTELLLTSIRGVLKADNLHDQTKNYGSVSARADTNRSTVTFKADSNLSGSSIHVIGTTSLAKDYPTSADVSVENLVVENLPFDFGVPVKGTVAIDAHAQGTLQNPVATARIRLVKGEIEGEPIDRMEASGSYTPSQIEISSLDVTAPAGTARLNGSFFHPVGQYASGTLQLHLASGDLHMDRIHAIQSAKPGLAGTLKVGADVEGSLRTVGGNRQVTASRVDVTAGITGFQYAGKQAGDAKLTGKTSNGAVAFTLDSNLAQSAIHAQGDVKLTADYPVNAQFSARNIQFSNLRPFLNVETIAPGFDASAEIEGSVSGNARTLDQLRGEVRIPRLEASARARGNKSQTIAFKNDGPIVVQLDHSALNVKSAHITGAHGSDVTIAGTAGFEGQNPLRLTMKGNADLGVLQDIDSDFYSSGAITLDASLHGSFADPLVTGSLQLKNASMNMAGISNGISNATGTIALNGSTASIRNLSAESGGGKVTLAGYAAYSAGTTRYSVQAKASRVRTRWEGVSVVNNATITMAGTAQKALISGTVTVVSLGINPQSDIGALLSSAATRGSVEETSTFLSNTRLDLRIRTAPDVRFESTFAQDLQGEADLNLVGTLANPGMTGRATISEGDLVFFGNQYAINRGVISFYDTFQINPQLNVSLETTVKSIDVVITLSGPIDNLKLSYRSDPPLQFEEIVALLATGRRPSSDPTIVATQAAPPQQSVGEMGESAIVSQAIASPVSSRLERVFGISQLKIDPTFQSGSDLPSAALTLQQKVAQNITFTYTQDYSQANSELVRVEWAISPRFSAVALRDINGIFGIDFFYKRQFR